MAMTTDEKQKRRQREEGHIDQRWRQLYDLEYGWGKEGIKFLMLFNGGGAIATLGFIGASQVAHNSCSAKIALFLFFIGIVLTGALIANNFESCSSLFKHWKEGTQKYFDNPETFQELVRKDRELSKDSPRERYFAYGSFACFILGSFIGCIGLLCS